MAQVVKNIYNGLNDAGRGLGKNVNNFVEPLTRVSQKNLFESAADNFNDLRDNVSRVSGDAGDALSNATGGLSNFTPVGLILNSGRHSNELNRFGQDVSGVTKKNSDDAAATAQNNAQADSEAAMRHQKRLAENSADFKRQRNAQKIAQMISGGRAGTLLNGTAGVQTLGGAAPGSKTLLGQ